MSLRVCLSVNNKRVIIRCPSGLLYINLKVCLSFNKELIFMCYRMINLEFSLMKMKDEVFYSLFIRMRKNFFYIMVYERKSFTIYFNHITIIQIKY